MDTDTVTLFFALLATLAQALVAVAVVLAVGGRFVPAVARVGAAVRAQVGPQALALAPVVALVCTLGSLYLSDGGHWFSNAPEFPPCKLCWYQRIAMYPQVVVLAIAALRRDRGVRVTGIVLSAIGGAVSIYHLLVERYPSLSTSTSCDPTNPCGIKWVERFGYLTIPGMALSGFALIVVLLAVADPPARRPRETP